MNEATNPYAADPAYSPLEAQVLFEYLRLSQQLKRLKDFKKQQNQPHERLLATLRSLEKKMGLVLTLYKASVWATIVEAENDIATAQEHYEEQKSRADEDDDRTIHGDDGFQGWGSA